MNKIEYGLTCVHQTWMDVYSLVLLCSSTVVEVNHLSVMLKWLVDQAEGNLSVDTPCFWPMPSHIDQGGDDLNV